MKIASSKIPILVTEEIQTALHNKKPVVALESNVITHGLDYPDNLHTALQVEAMIRKIGAVPATIGIDNGKILIGMNTETIEKFATTSHIPKVSSRDLPIILAQKKMGATTVASSMVAAELAGIPFFCSSGIGGVHRGAENTMDISPDLIQFTRTKVAVVCAGAKKILDLNLTMEFLETHSVPIISYKSDDFPAFYCRSSGIKNSYRIDDEFEIAKAIEIHWGLQNNNAILITNPTKIEDAIDSDEIESVIATAVFNAKKENISGNTLTKYLMRAVDSATLGRSAKANMAVLVNTAEAAAKLAVAHAYYCHSHE